MKTLFSVSFPFVRNSKWLSKANITGLVPRAIYATSNPCQASNLKVLRMQQLNEKCCTGKSSSKCCDTNGSCRGTPDSAGTSSNPKTCCSGGTFSLPDIAVGEPISGSSLTSIPGEPQFYRRVLPSTCISFGSSEGKRIFGEALGAGHMNCYFPLAAQFRTQEEPAFCGLTTLVMVLNALAVDPGRVWKGPWRWYHENMLDCCIPLRKIETQGITLDQFNCLASCNALNVQTVRPDLSSHSIHDYDLTQFRDLVMKMSQREDAFIVCSYSRRLLSQTGDGHFSPIGGYHPGRDLVLILDTARFKYPPHWVPLTTLWEAMLSVDATTGLNRGFSLVQRLDSLFIADSQLIFKPSVYFSVNAPEDHQLSVKRFINSLESWAVDCVSPIGPSVVEEAVQQLVNLIAENEEDFHLLTTREDGMSCMDAKGPVSIPLRNSCLMTDLISSIKMLPIYAKVNETLERLDRNNNDFNETSGDDEQSVNDVSKPSPHRRIGLTHDARSIICTSADCGAAASGVARVSAAEFATMFLLAWPFNKNVDETPTTNNLRAYVEGTLQMPLPPILQQEIAMLRHQLRHIKTMFLDR